MKKKNIKEYLLTCVITAVVMGVVFLLAVWGEKWPEGFWNISDKAGMITGVAGVIFSIASFVFAKATFNRFAPPADSITQTGDPDGHAAIMLNIGGVGTINDVFNHMEKFIPKDNDIKEASLKQTYENILNGDLIRMTKEADDKSSDGFGEISFEELKMNSGKFAAANQNWEYGGITVNHGISVSICRKHGKGRVILISAPRIEDTKDVDGVDIGWKFKTCIEDLGQTVENVREYLAYNGISDIHLFAAGPLVFPPVLVHSFKNRFVIHNYHFAHKYYLVSKLSKS